MHVRSFPVVCALLLCGCASIESVGSSVDSAAGSIDGLVGSFQASSESSFGGGESVSMESDYLQDVRVYTRGYLRAPSEPGEFARGLGQVARIHGINDWEADPRTLVAIEEVAESPGVEETARARLRSELEAIGTRD